MGSVTGDCRTVRGNVYFDSRADQCDRVPPHLVCVRVCACCTSVDKSTKFKRKLNTLVCWCVLQQWLNRRSRGKDLCRPVCGIWSEGDRWCLSQLQRSQTVYPGGIAHKVCFDEQEHQKEIVLPLTHRPHMARPNLSLLLPVFFIQTVYLIHEVQ